METINERITELISELGIKKIKLADTLNVSHQYISKLTKHGMPSDMFIDALCIKFDVNEEWLRTGAGDMFVQNSRNNEIAAFIGRIMKEDDDVFKKRFVAALASLDVDGWLALEQFIESVLLKEQD